MNEAIANVGRSTLYPIGLKLDGRPCLVVGSGLLARRKTEELLSCGAQVRVVAPEREFDPADLDGMVLVVVAIDDRGLQEAIASEAERRGIPCNVVDVNELCTFYAPAVLRRGALTVSVATDGKFPLLAVAIKERIGALLGDAIGPALEILNREREHAFSRIPSDANARTAALRALLSEPAINAILNGRLDELEAHCESWRVTL